MVRNDADGNIAQHVEYIPYGEVFVEERNNSFSTNYLFNAKELDDETGLYYYGARYLDPTGAMWLSVDPMFEKNVGATPYNYCHGNPIRLVDPDGCLDYFVDDNGNVTRKEIQNSDPKVHTIWTSDKSKSLTLKNNRMLEELSGSSHKTKVNGYRGDYTISKDNSEMGKLYTFLASNTSVEWGLSKFKNGKGGHVWTIETTHERGAVQSFYKLNEGIFNVDNLVYNVHSHPDLVGATKGASSGVSRGGKENDFTQIYNLSVSFSKRKSSVGAKYRYNDVEFPKFFVFHRQSSHLYQYTPATPSIDLGHVDDKTSLYKLIDISHESTYNPTR